MIRLESPNHGPRPADCCIDMLVIHYTGMPDRAAALDRMCDPAAQVSAHYCVDEDGTLYQLVDESRRAWHAGRSFWRGPADVNDRSIGIELVNPGHEFGYRPFPEAQMLAVRDLARDILSRHPISPQNVVGHADIAPMRKQDPGELFDWQRMARWGIGLWPPIEEERQFEPDRAVDEVQLMLAAYGYEMPISGILDEQTRAVISAFQRHFRPRRVDGRLDAETVRQLELLIELVC
jgi:N-acetylmuramoyl-L-alanine amidase